jgi:hypothetical protein
MPAPPAPAPAAEVPEKVEKQRLGLFRKLKEAIRSSGAKVVDTVGKSFPTVDMILVPAALADEMPGAAHSLELYEPSYSCSVPSCLVQYMAADEF